VILGSGIVRVVLAVKDPNPKNRGRGMVLLRKAGVEVVGGVCGEEAEVLLAPFSKWITTGIPLFSLKMAMSLDGRIADIDGRSSWISSEGSRKHVKNLRSRVDAVLVGSGTVCSDDPGLLPARHSEVGPYRVVVDSAGRVPLKSKILNDEYVSRTIIAVTKRCPAIRRKRYEAKGALVWQVSAAGGAVSLRALAGRLGGLGLHHVVCEGGAELAFSLIKCGLVDRYLFFVAPKVLGGRDSLPAVTGGGWRLKSCPRLKFLGAEIVGKDIIIEAVPEE
jgi:diaminohydroxyphosphoribosylaminopyrimidine deaminase/5-amino-6-(5-phosphoribosylamino)uracil reductase